MELNELHECFLGIGWEGSDLVEVGVDAKETVSNCSKDLLHFERKLNLNVPSKGS